ncbi:hypothetical protein BCV70DRAFT_101950 [Testicularia cyperi]|uniref:Uncharacterized protein n=1 Tax=Testicularia cyperi TaxID=1882483 RepID=A0A317XF11_9BASI|nr:hypothetical protein BCV70DRAFT_101950 [Testicularia cyperi]
MQAARPTALCAAVRKCTFEAHCFTPATPFARDSQIIVLHTNTVQYSTVLVVTLMPPPHLRASAIVVAATHTIFVNHHHHHHHHINTFFRRPLRKPLFPRHLPTSKTSPRSSPHLIPAFDFFFSSSFLWRFHAGIDLAATICLATSNQV